MQEVKQKTEEEQRILQLGSFLTAFGNHEAKALLFLSMNRKEKYFSKDLLEIMRQIQGDHPVWNFNRAVLLGYCDVTFIPHKLVDIAKTSEGAYYRKTDYAALAEP